MSSGVITGNEVLRGVKEEIAQTNTEMLKLLQTFNQLQSTIRSANNGTRADRSVRDALSAEKATLDLLQRRIRLQRQELQLERDVERTKQARIRTQNAENAQRLKAEQISRRQKKEEEALNNFYIRQSRELTNLRKRYKDLELRKRTNITLTKQEQTELRTLGFRIRTLDTQLKAVDASAGQFGRNVGNYSSAIGGFFRNITSIGKGLGIVALIQGLTTGISRAADVTVQFDQSQADLAAILGTNRDEIAALTEQAEFLGRTTAFSATQVAQLQLELSKLGFDTDQILAATLGVENLAIATGVDAPRAAAVAAGALRGFNLEASEANRVAAALAVSTTRSGNTFQSLEIALPKVAAFADTLNFSLEDTVALLGALQNAGFEASISGTSLRQIFAALADENSKLQRALGGNVRGFDDFIVKLRELNETVEDPTEITSLVPVRAAAALAVLANGTQTVEELRDALIGVEDELDAIAGEKLNSISGQYRLLTSAVDGLILSLDNGEGVISSFFREAFGEAADSLNRASLAFDENATFVESFNILRREQLANLSNSIPFIDLETEAVIRNSEESIKNIEERKELISQIRRQSEAVQEQIDKYVELNGTLAPLPQGQQEQSPAPFNGVVPQGTSNAADDVVRDLDFIERAIADLKQEQRSLTAADTEQIASISSKIRALERERQIILDVQNANRQNTTAIEGSVTAIRNQIRELEKTRDTTATTREEYLEYTDQIEDLNDQLKTLTEGLVAVQKIQDQTASAFGGSLLSREEQEFFANGFAQQQRDEAEEAREKEIEAEKQKLEALKALREGSLRDTEALTQEQTRTIRDALRLEERLIKESRQAREDLIFGSIAAIAEARLVDIEEEIRQNREKLDILLEDENLSEEQADIARKKFAEEERKLEAEARKREREAFLVNQGLAVAEIAINLARTIAAINLAAAAIDAITLGIGGQAYRATNIPLAIGTAAAQTGLVLAQTIPQFFTGKDSRDTYEGPATWGEKGREVRVTKEGKVEVSPNRTTPTFVKSSDIIAKSIPEFIRKANTPNSEIRNRMIAGLKKDESQRKLFINNNTMDLSPLKGLLKDEIRQGFKGVRISSSNRSSFNKY